VFHNQLAGFAILSICTLAPLSANDHSEVSGRVGAGGIVYQYVGRVNLGTGTVYGYFTQIAGIPPESPLFKGTPSESTAYFTFRADIKFTPLAGNGDLAGGQFAVLPIVVVPGDFKVYFDSAPNRNWNDPNTFSSGQVIATFSRTLDQQTVIGPISTNAATATLKSSIPVLFNLQIFNLGRIVPEGVTNLTTVNNTALAGGAFAFGGYGLAVGK
jgi:hypothetical protein